MSLQALEVGDGQILSPHHEVSGLMAWLFFTLFCINREVDGLVWQVEQLQQIEESLGHWLAAVELMSQGVASAASSKTVSKKHKSSCLRKPLGKSPGFACYLSEWR